MEVKQHESTKFMPLTSDIVFKRVFKQKENMIPLLEDILNIKINSLEYLDSVLEREYATNKECVLDILVLVNKQIYVNVEMQRTPIKNMEKRTTAYITKIMSQKLSKGMAYNDLKKCIGINILGYDSGYEVREEFTFKSQNKEIKTMEIIMINLRKEAKENKLKGWFKIFNEKGEIDMSKYATEEERIQRIAKLVEEINSDPEALELYERQMWAEMDYQNAIAYAKDEGLKNGREAGRLQGILENQKASAHRMFKKGFSKDDISTALDLPIKELDAILLS